MPKFNKNELNYFQAIFGARSIVTRREATGDKSVTIDKFEKEVLFELYDKDSFTRAGGAAPDGKASAHKFNIFDVETGTYSTHNIVIKYPKQKGYELRLYFNRPSDFYPDSDQDWFIFTRANETHPFIGVYPSNKLENLVSGIEQRLAFEHDYSFDEEDSEYQKAIASPQAQKEASTYTVTSHKRNASLAVKCIKSADYKCQIDSTHKTFISAASDQQYMEVHHLIPLSRTIDFNHSLDVPSNLVILCPTCHRAIHLGSKDIKIKMLTNLFNSRKNALINSGINISIDQLFTYYLSK